MSATKREQQPFVYGSLSKEAIYLKPLASTLTQQTPVPTDVPASTEDERAWKTIRNSADTSLHEDFLRRYPYSPHVTEVRQRLTDLRPKLAAPISAPVTNSAGDQNTGDLPRLLLGELRRVGCSRGINDGSWNIAAQKSLGLFNENARTTFDVTVASLAALNAVRDKSDRVCPLICLHGYKVNGDDYVEIVCKSGSKVSANNTCEEEQFKQLLSSSAEGKSSSLFTPEDAQRVAAMGSKLKLTMPAFAIGDTKDDVPASFRRFVGIWAGKVDKGQGRQKMLILTEALSDC